MCKWVHWKPAGPQRDAFHENAPVGEHPSSHSSPLLTSRLQSDGQRSTVVSSVRARHPHTHHCTCILTHIIMQTLSFTQWPVRGIRSQGEDTLRIWVCSNFVMMQIYIVMRRKNVTICKSWNSSAAIIAPMKSKETDKKSALENRGVSDVLKFLKQSKKRNVKGFFYGSYQMLLSQISITRTVSKKCCFNNSVKRSRGFFLTH